MRFFVLLLFSMQALAAIELSWEMPTNREDGSQLLAQEIDGYIIDYSINNEQQPQITISDAQTLSARLNDVQKGVYVFRISTLSEGVQGGYSAPVVLTLGDIVKANPSPPTIKIHFSCDNCQLEVK